MLECVASVIKTADNPERVRIAIVVDKDDPDFIAVNGLRINTVSKVRTRPGIGEALNFVFQRAITQETRIGWLADDIRYRTRGWDTIVSSHTESIVYGRDGYQDEKLATHPFIRTELPNLIGFLWPPTLYHICGDVFWHDLGKAIGSIAYDNRIYTKHLHPDCGLGAMDKTYEETGKLHPQDRMEYETVIKPTVPHYADLIRKELVGTVQ